MHGKELENKTARNAKNCAEFLKERIIDQA